MRTRIADLPSDMSQDERDASAAADGLRGAAPGTCHAEPTVCGRRCPRPRKRYRSGRTLCAQAGSCRDRAACGWRPGSLASRERQDAARLQVEVPTLRLDRDFQSSDSLEVDPDLRIILDDLGEHVVAVRAAEHDAGTSVDVNGPDRPGCTAAATGPDRGCHLDGEHLL